MAARLWRPWDDNDNTEKDIEKGKEKDTDGKAISEEMQIALLNIHQYLSQNGKIPRRIKETRLKLHRHTIERIIREFVQKSKRGKKLKTRVKLSGVDTYWKSLILQTIYGFYCEKLAPILDSLHVKIIKIFKGADYEFHYKRTSLYQVVQKLGFRYKKYDKRSVIMESMEIAA